MKFEQRLVLDATANVRETKDGFLVAAPRVARVGIQEYRGHELGRADMDIVRVMRPEAEVFHKDAMSSLAHRPITMNHPADMVDSTNWRKYAVGSVGDEIARDGDFIRVPIMLMDAEAIRSVKAGQRELSCGYTSDLDWTPGEWNGQKYDALMTNIRQNHVACVDAARGGHSLKIGDTDMNRTIMVDGLSVELSDKDASIVQRKLDAMQAQLDGFGEKEEEMEEEKEKKDALLATKDAEIATLKTQLKDATDPAKLDAAVKVRSDVINKAKVIVGDKLAVDGKSVHEIRKQAVDAKVGAVAKDWNESQVEASFAAITVDVKSDPLADALSSSTNVGDAGSKAYDAYVKGLGEAWNRPNGNA